MLSCLLSAQSGSGHEGRFSIWQMFSCLTKLMGVYLSWKQYYGCLLFWGEVLTDVPRVRARQGGEPQEPNAIPLKICFVQGQWYVSGCMFEEMINSDKISIASIIIIVIFKHNHSICGYTSSPCIGTNKIYNLESQQNCQKWAYSLVSMQTQIFSITCIQE